MSEDQWLPDLFNPAQAPEPEPSEPSEPATQPTVSAPYDTIDVALDGWTYRLWRQWLGQDEQEQRKNVDLLTDIFQQYDPSATSLLEVSKSQPDSPDPYSWVFRFGLFGDPAKVTEAIENIDSQLLKIAENFKVIAGTAKALVTRMDGTQEAVELPKDLVASDIATTMYRLLDLVQTGGVKESPETESRASELRQITSPASGEYCTIHGKTGEEHTDEEREADIWGTKGEEEKAWTPDYQYIPKALAEEGRWNEWADEVKEAISGIDKVAEDVKMLRTTKTSTPEQTINTLNAVKELVETTRSWFYEIATQVDQEPIGEEDKALAGELKRVFKDETMKTVFDNLSSMIEKVIAEKQTMVIPN
jgi:hypothetical protein